jgi:uncharacterized protein (TIGR00251 family)
MSSEIHLTVSPGAKRSEVVRTPEGEIRIRLAAPAAEGKANRELVRYLAGALGLSPSSVRLLRGATGRHKVVEVVGLSREDIERRLFL